MLTRSISPSPDLPAARARLLAVVRTWSRACITRYRDAPATDIHDQGTYTTGWEPYVRATGDPVVLAFLRATRDRIRDHFAATDQWHHGYWRRHEAHHGTEHFGLFLAMLHRLDPDDAETQRQLLDAAEHIGNWVDGIPAWFDPDTGLFRSMYLGTEEVRGGPGAGLNVPDHLRLADLALLGHTISKDLRYLRLADTHARLWASAIAGREQLPIGLAPTGPVSTLTGETEASYRSFVGMAGLLNDEVDRAENLLASNGAGVFLELWRRTGAPVYLAALRRLLDVLVTQVGDPDAGAAADAIRSYRLTTGDTRYDTQLIGVHEANAARRDPFAVRELAIEPDIRRTQRPRGIGKRSDKPNWFEDGKDRCHNPITLAFVANLTGDERLAIRALDLARTHLTLAIEAMPDGRHHGCAANTVSAIARGHGRDNGAGVLTAVGL